MASKYYEFIENNIEFIKSIGRVTINQIQSSNNTFTQTVQTIFTPKKIQSIPFPNYQSDFKIENASTSIGSVPQSPASPYVLINTNKQKDEEHIKSLNLIVNLIKKNQIFASFKVASKEKVLKYHNRYLKNISEPLILSDSICCDNTFQERFQPYFITLQQLPVPGIDMPKSWIYIGQWLQDFPHGIGKIFHHQFKYEGFVKRGIPHKKGRKITMDDIYEGEFDMNKREGFGRLVTRTQYFYEGQWRDNIREGIGYEIHKNGCVFQGQYEDDKVSMGAFYIPIFYVKRKLNQIQNYAYLNLIRTQFKEKYYGSFVNNKYQGKGQYVWIDGRTYKGEWKDGKLNGQGVFTWKSGKIYQGTYLNNKKHGFGKFFNCHMTYQGYWENGKQHGKGKIICNGLTYYKVWYYGKIIRNNEQDELLSLVNAQQDQFPSDLSQAKHSSVHQL